MSVPIVYTDAGVTIGKPVPLLGSRVFQGVTDYQVAADGRFLLPVPRSGQQDSAIAVVVNWTSRMKR